MSGFTSADFDVTRRVVSEIGGKEKRGERKREWEAKRLKRLGLKVDRKSPVPFKVGTGMAKKKKKRMEVQRKELIETGMDMHKSLKKKQKNQKTGSRQSETPTSVPGTASQSVAASTTASGYSTPSSPNEHMMIIPKKLAALIRTEIASSNNQSRKRLEFRKGSPTNVKKVRALRKGSKGKMKQFKRKRGGSNRKR